MRKSVLLLLALIVLGTNGVSATALRAINVQNAKMDTENHNELRINFDWFHDHGTLGGASVNSGSMTLPRIDWRHTFDTAIPLRIGFNTGLALGGFEGGGVATQALGFQNLGLTLEAGIVQEEDLSIALYINQHFPLVHSSLLLANTLRPQYGANAYGFQTGLEYQVNMCDSLIWYGDIGYRFDVPSAGEVQNSLVYYNEAVLGMGDDHNFGLSLGLLGNTVYNSGIGTDLRLVPGVIIGMGSDSNQQLRFGLPIGINNTAPDIGVQVSFFSLF